MKSGCHGYGGICWHRFICQNMNLNMNYWLEKYYKFYRYIKKNALNKSCFFLPFYNVFLINISNNGSAMSYKNKLPGLLLGFDIHA